MPRNFSGLLAFSLLFAGALLPFSPLQAQNCTVDLSSVIGQLTEAQALADTGNTPTALTTIADVQAALDALQRSCTRADALDALASTYSAPDESFRFQYPEGWFMGEFHEGRDWELLTNGANPQNLPLPPGGSVTLSSVEVPLNYSPYVALKDVLSVTVLVGNPLHLFNELGLYSPQFAETFLAGAFGFDELAEALETGIRQSPMNPDLLLTPVEGARPTLGFTAYNDATNLALVLVALDETGNLYALLVSPTLTRDNVEMLPLLIAMAASVEVSA